MGGIVRIVGQFAAMGVGFLIGGPKGAAIGNTLFNLLIPPETPDAQQSTQLSDLMREGAEIGSPIKKFYGVMPTAGDVIDCGVDASGVPAGIEETVSTSGGGGGGTGAGVYGGGSKPKTKTYQYHLTAMFLLGEGPLYVLQCKVVDASGERVAYDRWKSGMPNPVTDTFAFRDLWKQIIAQEIPYQTGSGIILTPEYEGGELIAELSQTFRLYPGTERQKADTALEVIHADEGVNNYRGYACVMFNKWGPLDGSTSFKFVVWSPVDGVQEIIIDRFTAAGIPNSRIKLESVQGRIHGAAITQVEQARNLPEKLAATQFCDLLFINGAFRDASRINPAYWTLQQGEIGAYIIKGNGESNYPSKTKINVKNEKELPSSLTIKFIDYELDYEENEAISQRNSASFENPMTIEIPIAAKLDDMIRLADVTLDEMWSAIGEEKIVLMPRYSEIAPGNVVNYQDATGPRLIRITNQDLGTKGPLEMTGAPYDAGVYGVHRIVSGAPRPRPTVPIYETPDYFLRELPNFDNSVLNDPKIIFAASTPEASAWSGATIVSEQLGTYAAPDKATIGSLVADYDFTEADMGVFRYDVSIQVQLAGRGELVSAASESAVRDGANLIAIGNLLVSFVTATPLGGFLYELSGLLPGRYGTDWIVASGVAAATAVLKITDENGIFDPSIVSIPFTSKWFEKTVDYEVFASDDDTVTTGPLTFTIKGRSVKPARPLLVKADDGAGGYNVTAYLSTRDIEGMIGYWDSGIDPIETDPRHIVIRLQDGDTVLNSRSIVWTADLPLVVHYTEAELESYYEGVVPATLSGIAYQRGTVIPGYQRIFTI